jgi:GABA permease
MRKILVVANQTATNQHLLDAIKGRAAKEECAFTLLVPAVPAKSSTMTGMLSASVNIPQSSGGDEGEEYRVAQHRLDSAIESFRQAGIRVDGNVGDPDPIKAIGAYLRYREFDEIIVSTLPRGISRWLHQDLPHRIERKFHLPVAVITAQQ